MANTTIAVSTETKAVLESIRKVMGFKTYDETVSALAKDKQMMMIKSVFGIGKGIKAKFEREKSDRRIA